MEDLKELKEHCKTPYQKQVVEALIETEGDINVAAEGNKGKILSMRKALKVVRQYASMKGTDKGSLIDFPTAVWERLKGRSALKDERTGELILQWYKTTEDKEKAREAIIAAVNAMCEEVVPLKPLPKPKHLDKDLLSTYILTDYHLGVLVWHEEGGEDWNLEKAEEQLKEWIDKAIAMVPASRHAVFAQLGDFLHFDGLLALTPTSGHVLDASARFPDIVAAATRIIRHILNRLLEKHETIHVLMLEGNHDIASSVWLRELFYNLYENEPRITVEKSPRPYHCIEFGKVSLFFHHGHLKKMESLAEAIAGMYREVFGRTTFSYAHTGHLHTAKVIESPLMLVEQHQTLAARDSHTSRHGYLSDKSSVVITYHKDFGEISRVRITAGMLKTRQAEIAPAHHIIKIAA